MRFVPGRDNLSNDRIINTLEQIPVVHQGIETGNLHALITEARSAVTTGMNMQKRIIDLR